MEEKKIRFDINKEKLFRFYVSVMNPFLNLSNRESEVLSQLLILNYEYKSYSEDVKWKLVFDKDNRKKTYDGMKISVHQYNNILSSLRKKKILLPGNMLSKKLLIYPDSGLTINFEMKLINEGVPKVHT
jgi:hypothetical protein